VIALLAGLCGCAASAPTLVPANDRPFDFARVDGRFRLARTHYFGGGPVDVYEVYRSAFY